MLQPCTAPIPTLTPLLFGTLPFTLILSLVQFTRYLILQHVNLELGLDMNTTLLGRGKISGFENIGAADNLPRLKRSIPIYQPTPINCVGR